MGLKRKFLASLVFALGVTHLNAAATYLTVELNTGDKCSFLLADKPVVTFKSGDLVVNGNAMTSYSIEGVKNFHFTESDVTDTEIHSSKMLRVVALDESRLQVQNLKQTSMVTLLNVSGALVSSVKADSEGSAVISLPQTKGVYILSAESKSFKIIKK